MRIVRVDWGRSLLLYLTAASVHSAAWAQTNDTLKRLADKYWDAAMERSPTWATSLGDYRFNDRLDDLSEDGRNRWKATLSSLLGDVERITPSELSPDDRLTRDLLSRSISDTLLRLECLGHFTPLDPLEVAHIQLPLLLVSQPFRDVADFRAYAARLREFPNQVADLIRNMRNGVELGVVSPCVVVDKVVPQIRTHIVRDAAQSEFHTAIAKASTLSLEERTAITTEIVDAITSKVVPAYLTLLAFVEDEYLPVCRSTVGLSAIHNGEKIYDSLAYLNTTVRVKPAAIHELGLGEVARIRGEMSKTQKEIGFDGTLDEFLAHLGNDPRYRFTSAEELVAASDAILRRTKPQLPKLFGRLPKADCVMKEIEPFRAAASPVAYYNPPPADGTRPGYYYINTYSPKERVRFTLEALSYHEAVPGHHLQIALDQENKALPQFRRYGNFTAYVEGWALYTEKLGFDIGGYTDPLQRFGQLTFEMWRACRLVVDTGLHIKNWTRKQAIDYMSANAGLAPLEIESEVDRYITWPGQALAYKIGELRISQLRREAEQKLGDRFDVRHFHDALLAGGAMPIELLELRMREWIASRAK